MTKLIIINKMILNKTIMFFNPWISIMKSFVCMMHETFGSEISINHEQIKLEGVNIV